MPLVMIFVMPFVMIPVMLLVMIFVMSLVMYFITSSTYILLETAVKIQPFSQKVSKNAYCFLVQAAGFQSGAYGNDGAFWWAESNCFCCLTFGACYLYWSCIILIFYTANKAVWHFMKFLCLCLVCRFFVASSVRITISIARSPVAFLGSV